MPGSEYRCVYANVEVGQTAREDVGRAMRAILGELAECASDTLGDDFVEDVWVEALERYGPDRALRRTLALWARADSRASCCSLTKSTRWSASCRLRAQRIAQRLVRVEVGEQLRPGLRQEAIADRPQSLYRNEVE